MPYVNDIHFELASNQTTKAVVSIAKHVCPYSCRCSCSVLCILHPNGESGTLNLFQTEPVCLWFN